MSFGSEEFYFVLVLKWQLEIILDLSVIYVGLGS